MSKKYLKTIMLVFVVSMMAFIVPNAFADCTNVDNSSLTLTPTTDSITANWLDIDCDIPDGTSIGYTLTLEERPNVPIENAVSPHNFSNLLSDTEYTVTLDIYYLENDAEGNDLLFLLGTITQTTRTLVVELEPKVDCANSDVNPDNSYMILSSTVDSITIEFSPYNIGCEIQNADLLFNFLTLDTDDYIYDAVSGATFVGLDPGTEYTIDLDLYYDGYSGTTLGQLSQTITTQGDPIEDIPIEDVPIEDDEPVSGCVDFNDTYLILSSTTDTITVEFPVELICGVPEDQPLFNYVLLYNPLIQDIALESLNDAVSGDFFEDLTPDTLYTITLDVYQNDGVNLGPLTQTILTLIEPEEPVECVNISDMVLILTSTTDSITATWSDLPICDIPLDAKSIYLWVDEGVLVNSNNDVSSSNSYTFSGIDPDRLYEVELEISYENLEVAGSVFEIIRTEVDCIEFDERFDDFYPSLSSTADTVTATWPDGPYCYVPIDAIVSTTLSLDYGDHIPAVSGHTFEDLQSLTLYTVELEFTYTDDGGERVLTFYENIYTKDVEPENDPVEIPKEKGRGGCADCVPPTIGITTNNFRIVENGFSYNNNPVDVERWHTPYPLITTIVNQTNTVEIIAYDNQGIYNLKVVQFGLGLDGIGAGRHNAEALIEVHFEPLRNENTVLVDKVVIRDRDNLIETFSVFAITDIVKCTADADNENCLKVTLQYSYREATINNILLVSITDRPGNTQNFYFNDGVKVIGDSLNEPPTYIIQNRKTAQQTEDLTLTLTRTDKVNHIWEDKYGIEYLQVSSDRFDRITPAEPYQCTDPPLTINSDRQNCHFRALTALWNN